MATSRATGRTPAPGGNLYVGPSLVRSLAGLALALAAAQRPADGAAPAAATT